MGSNTRRGVGIRGLGAVTGYGWGRKQLWDGLLTGESAVVAETGYRKTLGHDVAWVAHVPPDTSRTDGLSRFASAMSSAVDEAVDDAQARGWRPGPIVGLVHCVVLGEVDLWRDFYLEHDCRRSRSEYLHLMPSTPMSMLMQRHDFHGPCMAVSAMCASGNAGMLTAKMWIDAGVATDVIVLATDLSATGENMRHFRDLGVLVVDTPALDGCRPFQEGSRGFPAGEASVAFVVSSRSEGAYARVAGGAMSHDGFHAVSINPDRLEITRTFRTALENAEIDPSEVAYLNAHGPGTVQCDGAESAIFDELLPDAAGIFSVKPLAGHCQGAASAVELAASCLSYDAGVIPAPPRMSAGHPRLLDGVTVRRRGVTLKSSIGMGGHNSVLVLDEPEP